MTLQSIRLTIQSHKDSLVEFHPGVNFIIGRSRSGKSTILRGLIKVGWNRPIQGIERWVHKHNPKNISEVEVLGTEGHCVQWRGGNPQTYTVDGEELSGFKQTVPEAVQEAINLDEINISGQHDRAFLLFETPGEVARVINQCVDLGVIDQALANASSDKRRNDQEIKVQEVRLKEVQSQIEEYPDLEVLDNQLKTLEEKSRARAGKQARMNNLAAIQDQIYLLRQSLAGLTVPEGMDEALEWLLAQVDDYEGQVFRVEKLRAIQEALGALGGSLAHLTPGLGQEGWVAEMLAKNKHLQAKRGHLAALRKLGGQITQIKSRVGLLGPIIEQGELELRKEFGPQCPLCGQEMRDENVTQN